jgi:hypothetical protein
MLQLKQVLDLDEVEMHRREDCKDYDECLDRASEGHWKSFSCFKCVRYCRDPEFKIEPAVTKTYRVMPDSGGGLTTAERDRSTQAMRKANIKTFSIISVRKKE